METQINKICVIGLGYIGLPTAATFAARGLDVIGLDISEEVVKTINGGKAHIVEPELDMLVRGAVNSEKLRATTEPEAAGCFIVSVPTPITSDNSPNLSFVIEAIKTITPVLEKGNIVIVESTVPVGTTEMIVETVAEMRNDLVIKNDGMTPGDVHFVHCPERVLPGKIITELVENDRIIGGYTPECANRAADLYRVFVRGELLLTDAKTAEMTKLVENAYRDVNIAYANELSLICDELDINVWSLIHLANRHPRVNILQPGPGVGGHCIAVDPWFIVSASPDRAKLIHTARQVNDCKPDFVVQKVRKAADRFKKPVIACLGLAFKADIDDLRESPSLAIVQKLYDASCGELIVVEPFIQELPENLQREGISLGRISDALEHADIILLLVEHRQFKLVDQEKLHQKILIDTKGIWTSSTYKPSV